MRQTRAQVEGVNLIARINNRIQNRVQARLRNRIDRNYERYLAIRSCRPNDGTGRSAAIIGFWGSAPLKPDAIVGTDIINVRIDAQSINFDIIDAAAPEPPLELNRPIRAPLPTIWIERLSTRGADTR